MHNVNLIPLEKLNIKVSTGPFLFDILLDMAFTAEGIPCSEKIIFHNHPAFEIHFISRGSGFFITDEGETPFHAGDIIFVPPGVFHGFRSSPMFAKGYLQFTYTIKESYDDLFPQVETTDIMKALTSRKNTVFMGTFNILNLIECIQNELSGNRLGCYAKIQGLFTQLLIDIIRVTSASANHRDQDRGQHRIPLKTIDDSRTRIIDKFFGRLLLEQLSIEQLAKELNLSNKQTQRVVQQLYGKSFKQIVTETQMEIAKHLLVTGGMTIPQIAERLGFVETKYFSRRFAQITGSSPAKYRNMHGGERILL